MKVLSYDELRRDFTAVWATIESSGEDVVVIRGQRRVASIVPEPQALAALDVFGDLHGVLGEEAGSVLAQTLVSLKKGQRRQGTLRELRNPWVS